MATIVQRRRGTTAQHAAFTGALGETTFDTDLQRLVTHDGVLAGGYPAAMLHVANIFSQPQTISLPAGSPTAAALSLITDSVSRVTFTQDGYGTLHRQEADTTQGGFDLTKRGTTGNALAALSSGSGIANINWKGWDGVAMSGTAASVRVFTTEAWTNLAHGTKLFFLTTPTGSTTVATHATLSSTELEVMSRLLLPNTTSATVGGIYFGGTRAFHNFGTNNIFAGVSAGNLSLTGTGNTALGVSALALLSSGSSNLAIGNNALLNNTTGGNNTAVGSGALQFNTTAVDNVAIGMNSLAGVNTGGENVSIGAFSMLVNTSGAANISIGRSTLGSNTTGSSNVAIGRNALVSTSTASNSVAVGRDAGILATGANNIFLGFSAGDNVTSGANNIVLGHNIDSPTATNSNTLTIGNLIFGTGINGTGTTISTGSIGIGVITPLAKLHVGGGIYMATAGALSVASGSNQRAGNATLVGGSVTVANTTVTANTIVMLTRKTSGGTIGTAITYTVIAATSFTITADSALDTSTFSYMLIEVP